MYRLVATTLLALLSLAPAHSADWVLSIETYHDIALIGVHAQQKLTIRLLFHPPDTVRLETAGLESVVLWRLEPEVNGGERLMPVRYEIDADGETCVRVSLEEMLRRAGEQQRALGLPQATEAPPIATTLALEHGWRTVHAAGDHRYLQYWLAGDLVAAAAVSTAADAPPAELMFAAMCEMPVIHHYWVRQALCELLKEGSLFFFEFLPRGPQYYCLWVTEQRKEAGSLPASLFTMPHRGEPRSGEPKTGEPEGGGQPVPAPHVVQEPARSSSESIENSRR